MRPPGRRRPGLAPGPEPQLRRRVPRSPCGPEAGVLRAPGGRDSRAFRATREHPAPRRGLATSPALHRPPPEDPGLAREPKPRSSAELGPPRQGRRRRRGFRPTATPNSQGGGGGAELVQGKGLDPAVAKGGAGREAGVVQPRRRPSRKQGNPGNPESGKPRGGGGDPETPKGGAGTGAPRPGRGPGERPRAAGRDGQRRASRAGGPSPRPCRTPQRNGFVPRAPAVTQGGGNGRGS